VTNGPELIVFDFDGTLAHRPGMWTQCLLDVLNAHGYGHRVTPEDLRPHLQDGFPWHRPDVPHPELNEPERWWRSLGELIDRVYLAVGVDPGQLEGLRAAVRDHYRDASKFLLYDDTIAALEFARVANVRTVILSNHIPELDSIVDRLGLAHLVDRVLTSARIGVEKPHPDSFRHALGGTSPRHAWMVGDNPVADVQGARTAGMQTAHVRHPSADYPDVLTAVRHVCRPARATALRAGEPTPDDRSERTHTVET
jgi:putative hydrolase of the HAD superfamily